MLLIIETPHRGDTRTWMAFDEDDFVVTILGKHRTSGGLGPDDSYAEAVAWLKSDLRALEVHEIADRLCDFNSPEYPRDLTGDSAALATDGPEEEAVAELRAIIRKASAWPTAEAARLAEEAREYLKGYL